MSSSLASTYITATLVLLLSACASQVPVEIVEVPMEVPAKEAKPPPVLKWLRWQDAVSTMNASQLSTVLEGMAQPGNANQLFYYGLLHQQSDSYDDWVIARDIFRDLHLNEAVTLKQRQLAGLHERYSQNRINAFHAQDELHKQNAELTRRLAELKEQNRLLEQKIQAITDLESTISTRSEE